MKNENKNNKINRNINKSGIIISKEIRISAYNCEKFPINMMILQNLFIILVVASTIYSFTSLFQMELSVFVLNLVISVATMVIYGLCIIFRNNRNIWPLASFVILFAVLLYFNFEEIISVYRQIIRAYYKHYKNYYGADSVVDVTLSEDTTLLFAVVSIVLILIITFCITCHMSKTMYFCSTLPFILANFMVGFVPADVPFMVYIVSTLSLWCSSAIRNNHSIVDKNVSKQNNIRQKNFKDIAAVKIGTTMFFTMCIMLIIILVIFPKKNFNEENYVTNLRKGIQLKYDKTVNTIAMKFTGKEIFTNNINGNVSELLDDVSVSSQAGGISSGALGMIDGIKFQNIDRIKVSTSFFDNTIYLKAFVGLSYDRGWIKYKQNNYSEDKYSLENHSYITSSKLKDVFQHGIMEVNNISEKKINKSVIAPYAVRTNISINKNGYISSKGKEYNDFYFYNFDDIVDKVDELKNKGFFEGDYLNKEQSDDAIKYYLEVPKDIQSAVKSVKEKIDYEKEIDKNITNYTIGSYEKFVETINVVNDIRDYMANNYFYELVPGKVKADKDPIEYFLLDSKKGYCMYFAAATTAIFREYGIPSRYVEGYIVTEYDFKNAKVVENGIDKYKNSDDISNVSDKKMYEMSIKDTNAHAWTEIYMDGLGWVPVEVTGNTLAGEDVTDMIRDSYVDETARPDIQGGNTPTPTPDVPDNTQESNTNSNNYDNAHTNTNEDTNTDNIEKTKINVYVVIALIILVVLCTVIGVYIYLKKRAFIKLENAEDSDVKMIQYMAKSMDKIFKENKIIYQNNMDYLEYAKLVSDKFEYIEEEHIQKIISLIIKECFSKEGVTKKEYENIRKFYNYFMETTTKEWSCFKKWYYTNIRCIKFEI